MNPIKAIHTWAMTKGDSRTTLYILFVLSFIESCLFFAPVIPLLITLSLLHKHKAPLYAFIATAGSLSGGIAGYLSEALHGMQLDHFFYSTF